ncbi:MAG: YitT family protein [Lysinibacillus sp.]
MDGTLKSKVRKIIMIIIGAAITAYGLEAVLIPNSVIDGGVTGISIMAAKISGLSLGIFLFILNIPFVYLGYKQVGRSFAILSTIGIAALSVSTILMHGIDPILSANDPLLVVASGGILLGVGIGIVLRNGGALDGSEVLAVLVSRKVPFSVGDIILAINVFIFAIAAFVYDLEAALYSALTYYIAKTVIDIVQVGLEKSKQVKIISKRSEEVGDAIQARLGRSITYSASRGGFSNEEFDMITCIINRMEETKMLDIVKEKDPAAFIVISDVAEVRGGNFKKRDIH